MFLITDYKYKFQTALIKYTLSIASGYTIVIKYSTQHSIYIGGGVCCRKGQGQKEIHRTLQNDNQRKKSQILISYTLMYDFTFKTYFSNLKSVSKTLLCHI